MLDDESIARYARQIVVPGIGATGQAQLLASTVLLVGNARGCETAGLYLRAAGVTTLRHDSPLPLAEFDVVVLADAGATDEATRALLLSMAKPICWYSCGDFGFTAGTHPECPMPSPRAPCAPRSEDDVDSAFHDAGATDAAVMACAILLGIPRQTGPFRFEI